MNSKFIRSFAVLSIATLLLGACGGSKGNNENSSEQPDNPTPVEPDGNFKLATSLEEAKIFTFRDLELPDEEEQINVYAAYIEGVNEVKEVWEEYYLEPASQSEWFETREGVFKFFQDDFMESEYTNTEIEYTGGVHQAQSSSKQHVKMECLPFEGIAIAHYETEDLIDNETYYAWERQDGFGTYGQRFTMLMMLAMTTTNGNFGGVFKTENASYWVYVDVDLDSYSGTDYFGNDFYYQVIRKNQALVEIKDSKIAAATVYTEIFLDHNYMTGELLQTPWLVEREFERFELGYGELPVSQNKATFLEKAPAWAVSPDLDDTKVSGNCCNVTLHPNTGEINGVGISYSVNEEHKTRWVEGEKVEVDATLGITCDGTGDAIGLVISAESVFYPITDLENSSSANINASIVAQLAEALGSQAKVSTYNSVNYLVIDKDIKEIHLTATIEYNDKALANVVVSNVELVR